MWSIICISCREVRRGRRRRCRLRKMAPAMKPTPKEIVGGALIVAGSGRHGSRRPQLAARSRIPHRSACRSDPAVGPLPSSRVACLAREQIVDDRHDIGRQIALRDQGRKMHRRHCARRDAAAASAAPRPVATRRTASSAEPRARRRSRSGAAARRDADSAARRPRAWRPARAKARPCSRNVALPA